MKQTQVYANLEALSKAAAQIFAQAIEEDVARFEHPAVVLAGGSTPQGAYQELVRLLQPLGAAVHRVSWILGDERWVPVDDPASNEGMVRRLLLGPLGVPEERILPWQAGSGNPVERARSYQQALQSLLGTSGAGAAGGPGEPAHPPDLTLLGIGEDGHTASLFPDGVVVPAQAQADASDGAPVGPDIPGWAAAIYVPHLQSFRLTLTAGLLRTSRRLYFLAAGQKKREPLRRMLDGDAALPAAWLYLPQAEVLATRDAVQEPRV